MMKHQLLVLIGLIGMGVVLGATLINNESDTGRDINTEQLKRELAAKQKRVSVATNKSADNSFTDVRNLESIQNVLSDLQNQLQTEVTKRKQLETKVALLEKQLKADPGSETVSSEETGNDDALASETSANPHQGGAFGGGFSGRNDQWFNEQAMLDAGIDPTKVNYIKDSFEQAEMDKLYLRDQATREGWINTKRYTDSAKEIEDRTKALRNELSESEYDAYLFAAGRANRVIVSSLLSASPASSAGIQAGDTILKYDNKRIYNWSDLTSATSDGTPNQTVTVTIERNGQTQQVYIPRGPLGIRLTSDSVPP